MNQEGSKGGRKLRKEACLPAHMVCESGQTCLHPTHLVWESAGHFPTPCGQTCLLRSTFPQKHGSLLTSPALAPPCQSPLISRGAARVSLAAQFWLLAGADCQLASGELGTGLSLLQLCSGLGPALLRPTVLIFILNEKKCSSKCDRLSGRVRLPPLRLLRPASGFFTQLEGPSSLLGAGAASPGSCHRWAAARATRLHPLASASRSGGSGGGAGWQRQCSRAGHSSSSRRRPADGAGCRNSAGQRREDSELGRMGSSRRFAARLPHATLPLCSA